MPSNYTEHYQLNQWEPTDQVLRTDFNADNGKIDGALNALAAEDAALEEAMTAVAAGAGNCEMEVITYTGTGTYGAEIPTQIRFAKKPDIYMVAGDLALVAGHSGTTGPILACKDATYSESFVSTASASWSGAVLSLSNGVNARYQMNTSGKRYWALGLRKKG